MAKQYGFGMVEQMAPQRPARATVSHGVTRAEDNRICSAQQLLRATVGCVPYSSTQTNIHVSSNCLFIVILYSLITICIYSTIMIVLVNTIVFVFQYNILQQSLLLIYFVNCFLLYLLMVNYFRNYNDTELKLTICAELCS